MSKDLTTSEIDCQNILNNRYALAEIENSADIQGIPFEGKTLVLKEQVAAFFEVSPRTVDNVLEKFGPELVRNGYVVLKGKRLKDMKLAIQAQDVHETDFVNISKTPQLGVFDFRAFLNLAMLMNEIHRAALVRVEYEKKLKNIVDAACLALFVSSSRPAGPILSSRRVKHTSAGIFLPQRDHQPKEVAV